MVLDPFTYATTESPDWDKNLTMLSSPTKTHVKNASFNVDKARWQIYLWVRADMSGIHETTVY